MTSSSPLPPAGRGYGRVLGEAFGIAAAVVSTIVVLVWLFGVVPAEHEGFLFFGLGAAIGASGAAILIHGRILAMRPTAGAADGALLAGRLQGLLGAAFVIKLAVVGIAVLVLRQAGVKFEAIAVFVVTFAASSVVGQVISAWFVARGIARPATASGTSPRLESETTPPC